MEVQVKNGGCIWRWEGGAGAPSPDPFEAPQRSSASGTQYYMLNDERTIEKRSYQVGSVTAGDTNDDSRYAEWQMVNGSAVPTRAAAAFPSELFSAYAITLDVYPPLSEYGRADRPPGVPSGPRPLSLVFNPTLHRLQPKWRQPPLRFAFARNGYTI